MLLSYLWFGFLCISLFFSVLDGQGAALTAAVLEGAQSGVTLCLSLAGTICLWTGITRVMEAAGLTEKLSKLFGPLLHFLFPNSTRDAVCTHHICTNFTANLMGLGNAATPAGILAVQRMCALQQTSAASNEMCRLIVLNTASIQLIPTTVGAVRMSAGSNAPFEILPAVWITSLCSVAAGLCSAKLFEKRWH